jgi:hypothetical protein
VQVLAAGADGTATCGGARLLVTDGNDFLADPSLTHEVFGPSSLIVRVRDTAQIAQILESLQGQLTATLHLDEADYPLAASLLPILERKAGRILANGWPTGVEVSRSMVHGGPFPDQRPAHHFRRRHGHPPLPAPRLLPGNSRRHPPARPQGLKPPKPPPPRIRLTPMPRLPRLRGHYTSNRVTLRLSRCVMH